ncbi:hypothetical protein Pan54_03040 [Rubinisphaera italica]|uniref:Uncharacterized protein n=1 Tax=Rubinisphaera italica TaxID=2527969 RepID=A0A5C5X9D1_9PLAN|nr:hypothetical protein Pan54_03040 [Rubinisphaera italica]
MCPFRHVLTNRTGTTLRFFLLSSMNLPLVSILRWTSIRARTVLRLESLSTSCVINHSGNCQPQVLSLREMARPWRQPAARNSNFSMSGTAGVKAVVRKQLIPNQAAFFPPRGEKSGLGIGSFSQSPIPNPTLLGSRGGTRTNTF